MRSSGLFEDSISQPFSGIYETYLLPNNSPDEALRLKQLEDAVRLVYASVFSPTARGYFEAIHYRMAEEKMAVLVQTVVGQPHGGRFYPHLSGVAQSYNYYPVSYLKPQDGIAVIGFGLGKYVIDGEKAWRFCPRYPKLEFSSPEELLEGTQTHFYALDLRAGGFDLAQGEEATLLRLPVSEAEPDGTLEPCTSVWDPQNSRLLTGPGLRGPRVVNFAQILQLRHLPAGPHPRGRAGDHQERHGHAGGDRVRRGPAAGPRRPARLLHPADQAAPREPGGLHPRPVRLPAGGPAAVHRAGHGQRPRRTACTTSCTWTPGGSTVPAPPGWPPRWRLSTPASGGRAAPTS